MTYALAYLPIAVSAAWVHLARAKTWPAGLDYAAVMLSLYLLWPLWVVVAIAEFIINSLMPEAAQ
ncbi:MAG: hypothetical protein AAFX65_10550 [Cyanobacteria bacterium J06638_7]